MNKFLMMNRLMHVLYHYSRVVLPTATAGHSASRYISSRCGRGSVDSSRCGIIVCRK